MRTFGLLLLLLGPAAPLCAQTSAEPELPLDSDLARAAVERGEILPLSVLLPRLRAEFAGDVLDIELDLDAEGHIVEYEFELLTPEGRLVEVDMDAATGEVTEVGPEGPEDDDDEYDLEDD